MNKKYRCGLLYYGSIYKDTIHNNFNIIDGPIINVRLSGYAFINKPNEKLTRNFHPLGMPIKSSIILFGTYNIENAIKIILKREYYKEDDSEPICFLKRKKNNKYSIKIPYYDTYINIYDKYIECVTKLYNELIEYSKEYDLDYIFFISYNHNLDLLNINNNLDNELFNIEIQKLFLVYPKHLYINTCNYLLMCNPNTYSYFDRFLLNNNIFFEKKKLK